MPDYTGDRRSTLPEPLLSETTYDRTRLAQWQAGQARGDGISRRDLVRLSAGLGLAAVSGMGLAAVPATPSGAATLAAGASVASGPIVKPLPPELFIVYGSNAEMRWEAMRDQGYLVSAERFFVRNHTQTPLLDADQWRLRLFGTGLRGAPTLANPVEFSYRDLLAMPMRTVTAFVECTGNGRSFFTSQQGQAVAGTPWRLGAVGVARWRGVPLAAVLRRAGLTSAAVDVLPQGLDPDFISGGVNYGQVRRPLPIAKALDDVLLAVEMNGEPLPPDHGFPVRLVVPSWVGISSIKWVGQIEVSDTPLFSPWNTVFYRLFGPTYPPEGAPFASQVTKSAFELAWDAPLPAGQWQLLRGRSWSGEGEIEQVEVSTDGGATWRRAHLTGPGPARAWQRWQFPWRPTGSGSQTLMARATTSTGATQPDTAVFNTQGYLFGAVVRHPVLVT